MRKPSAWIPVAMSLAALSVLAVALVHGLVFGFVRATDEGVAAHLWQILMAGQIPVAAFFAIKWLPRAPKQALMVLALQAGLYLASLAPVFYFNL